jgi:hypothetical protein
MLMMLKKGHGENGGENSALEKFKENVNFLVIKRILDS